MPSNVRSVAKIGLTSFHFGCVRSPVRILTGVLNSVGLELNESAKWLDTADHLVFWTYKEPAAGPVGVPSHAWQSRAGPESAPFLVWRGLLGLRSEAGRRSGSRGGVARGGGLHGHWGLRGE